MEATIRELRVELEEIDRTIAALELLAPAAGVGAAPAPGRKRGRKGMNPEERQQVSERIKRYWAQRRGHPEKTA